MRTVLKIFYGDLQKIRHNVMTAIVIFGLVIIPMLFSSFNVLASWNPFDNTDRLKIAVASTDEGYDSDLIRLRVNLGDQVLSQLSRNDQIDWVVTDEATAVDGTKSGEYYASIVLPPTFSTDLLTFFVQGTEPSRLALYTNEKKNALSTLIAPQSAEGVISQINDSFTRILSNVGLGLVTSLSDYLNQDDTRAAVDRIESRVRDVGNQLSSGAQTVRALGALVDSTVPLVDSVDSMVSAAGAQFQDNGSPAGDGTSAVSDLQSTLDRATGSLGSALDAAGGGYDAVRDRLDDLFSDAGATSDSTAATLNGLADRAGQQADSYRAVRSTLVDDIGPALPPAAAPGLDRVVGALDTVIDRTQDLHDSFRRTAQDITGGNTSAQEARQRAGDAVTRARDAVSNAVSSYRTDLKPQLDALGGSLRTLGEDISTVREDLGEIGRTLSDSPGSLQETLGRARDTANTVADSLDEQSRRFSELENALATAGETGDFSRLREIVGSDPETLASQLAAPMAVDRQPVFPVAGFGVGMAPLYTVLSLWIGALLTAVLIRIGAAPSPVKKDGKENGKDAGDGDGDGEDADSGQDATVAADAGTLPGVEQDAPAARAAGDTPSPAQAYFGHFGVFALIGLAQSTLAMLSLIVFVQIKAEHPLLLLLTGWVTSVVFMLVIYTLVLSFGSAGKAISVFLLVVQVSGSGGAYPLPLLPQWFQSISPWLPATYGIDAMRSAVAGVYQGDIWIYLGKLLLFVVPALVLGLFLRRLLDGYNRSTTAAIESTRVMSS
ncbi:YhgE/Pip domain-containing protein [Corynebacterium provencense]|uniref:YhgE/Pip domain-containing protein n=1 Tax=Corynebacterium provencense TaxID=1737425 RepID=UPI000835B81F|nr:YhgE/Pip domain-containing protein [Corynebacterium provencense]